MSRFLFPTEYYDSTYSIDFQDYYNRGFRGVLFDIDNTLVPHNFASDQRSIQLMKDLKQIGFKICLVSNNKEARVASFNEYLQVEYIYKAGKPKGQGYVNAMKKLGTNRRNTFFVGDQLFTDIWGANNAKLHAILVKPIDKHEEIQIVLKRILEKPILFLYLLGHKMKTGK
jgi:hypothetical protein